MLASLGSSSQSGCVLPMHDCDFFHKLGFGTPNAFHYIGDGNTSISDKDLDLKFQCSCMRNAEASGIPSAGGPYCLQTSQPVRSECQLQCCCCCVWFLPLLFLSCPFNRCLHVVLLNLHSKAAPTSQRHRLLLETSAEVTWLPKLEAACCEGKAPCQFELASYLKRGLSI